MNYNSVMDISTLIQLVTGQFGALVLACVVIYHLMSSQKESIVRLYNDHKEDRELYRTTLTNLSIQINRISDDVAEIKKGMQ